MIVFVSLASSGVFTKMEDEQWVMGEYVGKVLAKLHIDNPGVVYIAPSIQNYVLLPYIDQVEDNNIGPTYESWKSRCRQLIEVSDKLVVIKTPGWEKSVGVADEIAYAKANRLPIEYIDA